MGSSRPRLLNSSKEAVYESCRGRYRTVADAADRALDAGFRQAFAGCLIDSALTAMDQAAAADGATLMDLLLQGVEDEGGVGRSTTHYGTAFWAQSFGSRGNFDNDSSIIELDRQIGGVNIGGDVRLKIGHRCRRRSTSDNTPTLDLGR